MKLETITETEIIDLCKKSGRLRERDSKETKVSIGFYSDLTNPVFNTIVSTIGIAYTLKLLVDLYLVYK